MEAVNIAQNDRQYILFSYCLAPHLPLREALFPIELLPEKEKMELELIRNLADADGILYLPFTDSDNNFYDYYVPDNVNRILGSKWLTILEGIDIGEAFGLYMPYQDDNKSDEQYDREYEEYLQECEDIIPEWCKQAISSYGGRPDLNGYNIVNTIRVNSGVIKPDN